MSLFIDTPHNFWYLFCLKIATYPSDGVFSGWIIEIWVLLIFVLGQNLPFVSSLVLNVSEFKKYQPWAAFGRKASSMDEEDS